MHTYRLPNGIYAASLTPLNNNGHIAHDALAQHMRWLMDNGCNGVVLMGTTGEANSFSTKERMESLDAVVKAGIPADRLMIGTGCCAISDTVMLTKHALAHGTGGILMLSPFYYKNVHDDGVFAAFDEVIQRIGTDALEIYLYHFPTMSAVPFTEDLIGRLLQIYPGTIAGIKDSSGNWAHMKNMMDAFPGFRVFAGTERYLSDTLQAGGAGCITATTNVTCRLASAVFAQQNSTLQERLTEMRAIIETYPMIPALKHIMTHLANDTTWHYMRPPQVPLPKADGQRLLEKIGPFLRDVRQDAMADTKT